MMRQLDGIEEQSNNQHHVIEQQQDELRAQGDQIVGERVYHRQQLVEVSRFHQQQLETERAYLARLKPGSHFATLFFAGTSADRLKAEEILLRYIRSATKTLYICMYDFTSSEIYSEVVRALERGVHVFVIADCGRANTTNSVIKALIELGSPYSHIRSPRGMLHTKVCIVDSQILLQGELSTRRNMISLSTYWFIHSTKHIWG